MNFSEEPKEFDGKNLEDAIEKATKALAVSRDRLEIKVVCEEKKGLFGMNGSKSAKIKVTVKK